MNNSFQKRRSWVLLKKRKKEGTQNERETRGLGRN